MMKHVGLHNAQKITIVLNKLPDEEHMCLILVDDKLPPRYYQSVKKCLNTPEAQEAKSFATALENAKLDDGRNLAKVLFDERHFKKVPTNQVFATPYGYESSNKIKLNELNDYLDKIDNGGEALKKLEEFDAHKGMQRKKRDGQPELDEYGMKVEVSEPASVFTETKIPVQPAGDPKLASADLRTQSELLRSAAVQLLQQAKLLGDKAEQLFPSAPKRGRGRPVGTTKVK